jgi:CelD/BcsL family acetyltransferase involved in cellulose biosynthesis
MCVMNRGLEKMRGRLFYVNERDDAAARKAADIVMGMGHASAFLHTEIHTAADAFDDLRVEWDQLLEASGQQVYFLRRHWNQTWWQTFRPPHAHLFIVTCRDADDRLVGLAPLYWRQRANAGIQHIREILFLGTGVFTQTSEYLDLIARRGYEREVAEAIAAALKSERHWDKLWLSEIPAASVVLPHLQRALGGDLETTACQVAYYADTDTDWEAFKQTLGRTTRQNTQRLARRLFENYACRFSRVETPEELERGMGALVALHQARRRMLGQPGSFAIPGMERLLRAAARDALAEDCLRLWTLQVEGEIAAVQLAFLDNGTAHCFQVGFSPAYARESVGKVMLMLCIKDCVEDPRVRQYDFMGGDQPYKECWAKSAKENLRLVWLRSGLRSLAYTSMKAADQAGRSMARAMLPSAMKVAGHRLLERRHFGYVPNLPPLTLPSR